MGPTQGFGDEEQLLLGKVVEVGLQQVLHGYGCHGVDAGGSCAVERGMRFTPLEADH